MTARTDLRKLCQKHGLTYSELRTNQPLDDATTALRVTGEHFIVDWWPFSKNRTAYVVNTQSGVKHATACDVVRMACSPPPNNRNSRRRRQSIASRWKDRLWRKVGVAGIHCHWCGSGLTKATTTADHRIPLHRGGLDNANNLVPACEPCNKRRGHDMPETQS